MELTWAWCRGCILCKRHVSGGVIFDSARARGPRGIEIKREIELDMPKSLKRHQDDDFEVIFVDELQQRSDRLPLQNFTAQGGWPDDDALHIAVEAIEREKSRIVVTAWFQFAEVMTGSEGGARQNLACPFIRVRIRRSLQ